MLIALLVCLIPTTIGGLLSRDRHCGHGSRAAAQRARDERAARSKRQATSIRCCSIKPERSRSGTARRREIVVAPRSRRSGGLRAAAYLSSLADETPEGRSIVLLAARTHAASIRGATATCRRRDVRALQRLYAHERASISPTAARSAKARRTRCARGCAQQRRRRRGTSLDGEVERIARAGGTPLLLAETDGCSA